MGYIHITILSIVAADYIYVYYDISIVGELFWLGEEQILYLFDRGWVF